MFHVSGEAKELRSFKAWNVLLLKIQRDLCHPKSFRTFEKRASASQCFYSLNCALQNVRVTFYSSDETLPLLHHGVLKKAERVTPSTFLFFFFFFFCIGGATFLRMVGSISKPSAHYGCPSWNRQKTLLGSETRWRQLNRCCDTVRTDETCAASQASSVR